jgi:hypothetical protein
VTRTIFIKSAGGLLLLTAFAKLYAFFSKAGIVYIHDPILGFEFRDEFLVFGLVELAIACLCLFTRRVIKIQLASLASLGTAFAIYRIGLLAIGIQVQCPCLGSLSEVLHLSTSVANAITLGILIYILGGSYYVLLVNE